MIHVPSLLNAAPYSIYYWRKHRTLSSVSKQTVPCTVPVQSASKEISSFTGDILDPSLNLRSLPAQNELASCVVIPIADPMHKLIGVVGVDTMWSTKNQSNFEETELNFFQDTRQPLTVWSERLTALFAQHDLPVHANE
ncbi:hypothetical protein P879_06384 [Paragonimus westermani]|uniref:Uncharacterized protein n=1 Tax=Paragonimus westermani TaxID=34504 RepID=A0A8T0D7F0_9TREM|nr:hypothetical protein P879_06384 [Paragonimus westermani]